MKDRRFYAPSVAETRDKLSPEQLSECQRLVDSLQESYGPVPGEFNLLGWVWVQLALAQHNGLTDAELVTHALDQSYNELLAHLAHLANGG